MTRLLFFIHILFSVYALTAQANTRPDTVEGEVSYQPVKVYGYDLEYRLREGGKAQYNLLFKRMRAKGLQIELKIMPLPRANREFFENTNSCIFPSNAALLKRQEPTIADVNFLTSLHVDLVHLRVLTKQGSPVLENLEQLNGKRIAYMTGLNLDIFLPGLTAYYETTSSEGLRLKMLNANRLDAVLGFTPDILLAAEKLDLPLPAYDKTLSVFSELANMVCHTGDDNKKFIAHFNNLLKEMRASGELRKIFGPHVDLAQSELPE